MPRLSELPRPSEAGDPRGFRAACRRERGEAFIKQLAQGERAKTPKCSFRPGLPGFHAERLRLIQPESTEPAFFPEAQVPRVRPAPVRASKGRQAHERIVADGCSGCKWGWGAPNGQMTKGQMEKESRSELAGGSARLPFARRASEGCQGWLGTPGSCPFNTFLFFLVSAPEGQAKAIRKYTGIKV